MTNHFQDFLIIDIETVSACEHIEELSPELKKHWERKAGYIQNYESKASDELYKERAAIYAEFGKIIVIGMAIYYKNQGKPALRVTSIADRNEKSLLLAFKEIVESKFHQDNLTLCAHNGKEFDFPYLCRRMLINNIQIPRSLNITGKKPWEIRHVDTMGLWTFGDRKGFTSLDLMTAIFHIPSSKGEMDGSMVTKTYYEETNGLIRIEEYCKRDVIATAQLYLRLNHLPLIEQDQINIVSN